MKRFKGKQLRFLITSIIYLELCVTGSFAQTDLQSSLPVDQLASNNGTISINVKDIEIGDFFSAIARRRKINIVLGKNVSGTISVNLHNVPLTKALYAISRANEYQCIKKNGIYYILEENEGSGSNSNKKSELSSTVKSFRVNYAEISGVRKLIEDIVGEDSVAVHQEAKTLIVNDTMENIAKVEKILKSVDYPPHQVLIEAKILEIQLGDNLSFGVDWEKTFKAGNYAGTMTAKNFALPEDTEGASGFFMEVFKNNQKLQANLDALESQSDLNVLATPKLWAVDGKPAEILIGGRLGYYEVTTTETSTLQSVQFLDTGTQLNLTPHISKDGKILMDIHPAVSEGTIDALGLPSSRTTEVSTSVLAEHGDTIFIGGLIRQAKQKTRRKIPFIGSIPLIGIFFGRTEDKVAKNEIIVIITPYIISPEEQMIKQEKVDIVKRAEDAHDDKQTTVEKLFSQKRMFEEIQGAGDREDFTIENRTDISRSDAVNMPLEKADSAPRYSLLVSSFNEQKNAEAMTENLTSKGYPAYLLATQDKTGTPISAVKIGPLDSQELAEEFSNRLKTEEGIAALTIEE
jgi:type IV pilus secretin PilQ/predicted competence protein